MNKEVAERASGDNSILAQVNKRLDGFDSVFDAKIKKDIRAMTDELDKAIAEAKGVKEGLQSEIKAIVDPQITEINENASKTSKGLEEAKKRLDEAEVKQVLNEVIEQITQNQMDDKFEEALEQVTKSMQQMQKEDGT